MPCWSSEGYSSPPKMYTSIMPRRRPAGSSDWTRQFRLAIGLDPLPAGKPAFISLWDGRPATVSRICRLLKEFLLPEDAGSSNVHSRSSGGGLLMEPSLLAIEVHHRLLEFYGQPTWRNPLPPVDELISTILSQNTNDTNRDRAFESLRQAFPDLGGGARRRILSPWWLPSARPDLPTRRVRASSRSCAKSPPNEVRLT